MREVCVYELLFLSLQSKLWQRQKNQNIIKQHYLHIKPTRNNNKHKQAQGKPRQKYTYPK